MFQVDKAILRQGISIETPYGYGNIRNLSTGCKTLLNIVMNPDKIVCVDECGPNVLSLVFKLDNAKICLTRPLIVEVDNDTIFMFNDKDTVVGKDGYNTWWSKEYERRSLND